MRIPLELFQHICSILHCKGSLTTLAALQSCSKQCYRIVTPYLFENLHLNSHVLKSLVELLFDTSKGSSPPLLPKDYERPDYMGPVVKTDRDDVPSLEVSRTRWIRSLFDHVKEITFEYDVDIDSDKGCTDTSNYLWTLSSFARNVKLNTEHLLFRNVKVINIIPSSSNLPVGLHSVSLFLHQACRPTHLYIENPNHHSDLGIFIIYFNGSVKTTEIVGVDKHDLPSAGTAILRLQYIKAECGEPCPSADHPFSGGRARGNCRFATYAERGRKLYQACLELSKDDDWDGDGDEGDKGEAAEAAEAAEAGEAGEGWTIVRGEESEEGINKTIESLQAWVEKILTRDDEGYDDDIYWEGISDEERQEYYKRGRKMIDTLKVVEV
ncbi:hypothetical protein I302_105862 [Kwoniella bestiolae CBS 10118]|uniref:F-box domain-containing protein n=1 Tax=Kwoniella bestiolae CBS 10118 TaxID=1296100 RepID=A0A1B9G2D9_9TREE|nr:hypothetical protein I302_04986 [Kwoniella bestiolae CBS 10118]OCF25175.1 hypothetical protein I302_04986 [Kwoniella bestiolae CBS 10118]